MREDTKRQVDFLIDKLELKGNERILDLACGFGRHSLEFARRGYEVTGVDITPAYIRYGTVVQMALFRLCASFAKYFQTDYIGVLAGRIIEIVNEPDAKTQS